MNNDTTIIDRNINIEKEYIPEIEEATVQKFGIKTQEPAIPDAEFHYSTYASGVQPQSNFYPLDAQEQIKPKRQSLKNKAMPNSVLAILSIGAQSCSTLFTTKRTPILTFISTMMDCIQTTYNL